MFIGNGDDVRKRYNGSGGRSASDHVEFRPLVTQTLARLRFTRLLADGGDDSEANHRWLREDLGIESIIPPIAGRPARGLTRRPLSPSAPTGLSPSGLWPAVESRDVHLGRQASVWRGSYGARLLATGQADPAARHYLQPVSGRSTGTVGASHVPSALQGCCLRFSTEQGNLRFLGFFSRTVSDL
jgi:hypothetical protein